MFIYSSPFRLDQLLFRLIGVKAIGPLNLTVLTMMSWTQVRGTATQFMPQAFQCLKIGSQIGARRVPTVVMLMGAVALTMLVCHIAIPAVIYNYGVFRLGWWPQGSGLGTVNQLASGLRGAMKAGTEDWVGIGLGGLTTLFLVSMRQRFVWWPFHPLGFTALMGPQFMGDRYGYSIFLGWLARKLVVRFGGFTAYKTARAAAVGLVVGNAVVLLTWTIVHYFHPISGVLIIE